MQKIVRARVRHIRVPSFLEGGGYDGISLEINAYQLDTRFGHNPDEHFSVETEVVKWIAHGKF